MDSVKMSITVGVPKEIKPSEFRVGLTPNATAAYIRNGHTVVVQKSAGVGSGFSDADYVTAGCKIIDTAAEVFAKSAMIVKVKEPQPSEYPLIREGQILYTYFHFAASRDLTEAMIKTGAVCVAYETLTKDRQLPLLVPMSEVAGKMSVQEGAKYLERPMGGRGILLGGVAGVKPGRVLIIGGGIVGAAAAKVAAGIGADVVIADVDNNRLRHLEDVLPRNVRTMYSCEENLVEELPYVDLLIGAVLVPGAKCPRLIRREHLKLMKAGSLIVDVAVDQGGCVETCRATTHENPTYVEEGILHYCVANIPGAVPYTSTVALNNATLNYGLALANYGWVGAVRRMAELASALNIVHGHVVHPAVAEAFQIQYNTIESVQKTEIGNGGEVISPPMLAA